MRAGLIQARVRVGLEIGLTNAEADSYCRQAFTINGIVQVLQVAVKSCCHLLGYIFKAASARFMRRIPRWCSMH